jgi:hypothetical protein
MLHLIILALTIILLIYFFKKEVLRSPSYIQEDFIDNIEGMEQKMKSLEEKEQETRMFCKLLRNKENQDEMDYMVENTNMKFQNDWEKQTKMINDIKKKIINLKLDKVDSDFINYNDNKNVNKNSLIKRKKQIVNAKNILKKPPIVNLNINNNL